MVTSRQPPPQCALRFALARDLIGLEQRCEPSGGAPAYNAFCNRLCNAPPLLMIALRPPEYFPGLPYMALVERADVFVLADTLRHRRSSMASRGKLRTPQGWQWISVPLKGGQRGRALTDVAVENRERWLPKHWRAFQYNYRSTPYFEFYEPEVRPFFEREWTRLGPLACASVELLARLMDLSTEIVRASALGGPADTPEAILEQVGAGPRLVLPEEAEGAGQHVLRCAPPTYRQNFEGFEPGLSAADLLFNCGPEATALLRQSSSVAPPAEAA